MLSEMEEDNSKCGECGGNSSKKGSIKCYGTCDKWFHLGCAKINPADMKVIEKYPTINWSCNKCHAKRECMMGEEIEKVLKETRNEWETIMKEKFETVIKVIKDLMFDQTIQVKKKIENVERKVEKKMDEDKKEMKKMNFVEVVKQQKREEVIVVQPKKTQKSEDTLHECMQKLKPDTMKVGIDKVINTKKGGLIIACGSKKEKEKFATEARKQLGDEYEIKTPQSIKPKIRIFDLQNCLNDEELVRCLKDQNEEIFGDKTEVQVVVNKEIETSSKHGEKRKRIMAVVAVDSDVFMKMIQKGRLNIGWERCRIEEYVGIRKCYKCFSYYHKSIDCKSAIKCLKCCGEHLAKDCESVTEECGNCIDFNKRLGLALDANRNVNSKECHVYVRKCEEMKKRIDYGNRK